MTCYDICKIFTMSKLGDNRDLNDYNYSIDMWSEYYEKMLADKLKKIKIFGAMKILNNFEISQYCVDIQNEQTYQE